jgi:subtilisin family serine protease
MPNKKLWTMLSLMLVLTMIVPLSALAKPKAAELMQLTDGEASSRKASHRLIVELEAPPLAVWSKQASQARTAGDRLNLNSPVAQSYLVQLQVQQAAAISAMQAALPGATVSSYINEAGMAVQETYSIVFNGFAVDPGAHGKEAARRALLNVPGVKGVYNDYAHEPTLYASLPIINASAAWDNAAIGGQANAGAGIKFASMDGGVHHAAPMFQATGGITYPVDFPAGGLGDPANNTGKIIASRAYFRSWDGPAPGDENVWPGEHGTSHGVHTASTAAGNEVEALYVNITETLSGVAPAAWVMSYRVFYASLADDGSFYDAEGVAALEDIVMDGADVLNNSWGGGPGGSGEFDAVDRALINAADAGIFVSMSTGNAGPSYGTTDHPADDYINVAASTTDGTYASGRLNISAPEPISPTLQNMAFATAGFGPTLPPRAEPYTFTLRSAAVISPTNYEGCSAWPTDTFTGTAALISRGTCDFSQKVFYAQDAGATFVVIHNNATGGDGLINMGAGDFAEQVTIPSVFIGHTDGLNVTDWVNNYGDNSVLEYDASAFQLGNVPDRIIAFSSRGPGAGNVLKPDIAAPGVNIMAQGYAPGAIGEARHMGYGQASGTSMASPHVAGAAVLLRQIHPDWSNAYIKSALMSTSRYTDVYNYDGTPAQPLDMGAGRLDLTMAADPGVILSPPSLSFGLVPAGTAKSITVTVTSVAAVSETYDLGLLLKNDSYPNGTVVMPGFDVSPSALTLAAGASDQVVVTFDSTAVSGDGDYQGYVTMDGAAYDAHMPAWARVVSEKTADILILDNDGDPRHVIFSNYSSYYTSTVEALGYTYDYVDLDARVDGVTSDFLDTTELMGYDAVLYFTGDYFVSDGGFGYPTPLSEGDMYALNAYAQNGGSIIAMGQDLSGVWGAADVEGDEDVFAYDFTIGGAWLQDSVSGEVIAPSFMLTDTGELPMAGIVVNLSETDGGDGADNQYYVDEIEAQRYITTSGEANMAYVPLLHHRNSATNEEQGVVAMAHREQPTLERPGVAYAGRSVYMAFGLEGVNNPIPGTATMELASTREELLQRALDWAWDEPMVTLAGVGEATITFTATLASNVAGVEGVSYRWDFGDGSPYEITAGNVVTHTYDDSTLMIYDVRVEAMDSLGNRTIGSMAQTIEQGGFIIYLPAMFRGFEGASP